MMTRFTRLFVCCLVSVFLLTAVAACSKEKEAESTAPAEVAKSAESKAEATAEAEPTADVEAMLAKADLVDGKADKIVTKCASCGLKMDGSSEHTLKASGYTLYFCNEKCAKGFSEDLTKSILAMKIPGD